MKWIVLIMFGALGASALAGGLVWAAKRYALTQDGVMTQGRVVGQDEQVATSDEGRHHSYNVTHTSYFPIVEFKTAEGETIRFTGTSGGVGEALLDTGTQVNVIYRPADPADALIVEFTQAWLGPLVLSVVGTVFLIFGLGGYVLIGKSDRDFEAMGEMMQRDALVLRSDRVRIEAKIHHVEQINQGGSAKYVLVCKGVRPDHSFKEEFRSDSFSVMPDVSVIGRTVHVSLDPSDNSVYVVELGPVLKEIVQRHR